MAAFSNKKGYVYMMSNVSNKVIYVGVTSNILIRVFQHKEKTNPEAFTAKYQCSKLVWYEAFEHIEDAIAREKQIKGGSRLKKIKLIESMNQTWLDLAEDW